MSICTNCRRAAFWGSLSDEGRKFSNLTFARPSRLGKNLTIEHCAEFSNLVESSESCLTCKFLSTRIPESKYVHYAPWSVKLVHTRLNRSLTTCLMMEVWEPGTVESPGYQTFVGSMLGVCNESSALAQRAIWGKSALPFTERVPVIESWLEACMTEHDSCRLTRTTYPARFLDLGEHQNLPSAVRLVYSEEVQKTVHYIKYVALSHCWGATMTDPYCTSKGNLEANMIDIPLHLLSRTFQDAIQVTRALGLRFLWIDSLCIVQDDKNDWTIEAAKMAQVYQGSYFTIAATSSTNSDGGLYLDSLAPSIALSPHKSSIVHNDSGEDSADTYFIRFPAASRKTIWDSRLSSRAWVLQEQVLSPRLIHFTEHQMFFQCFSGLGSEDGTVNDAGLSSLKGTALTPEGEMGLGMRDFSTPAQAISSWWSWVEEYSYRSLTFHSDRMAAVAGIVMYYRSVTLDEAILGLWKETLWSDLGWQVDDSSNQDATSRLPANIPTWSWLSVRPGLKVRRVTNLGRVTRDNLENILKVLEWDVQWEGPAFTSNLISSKLVVSCLLKPLGAVLPLARGKNRRMIDFEVSWDEFLNVSIWLDNLPGEKENNDLTLLCLFSDAVYEYFVLAKKGEDKAENRYMRLGSGQIHRPRGRAGFFYDAVPTQITLV